MVLESLVNPKKAENKPWEIFFVSIVYSFIAVFFAHALFPQQSSIFTIALITILFVPFFQRLFTIEEIKEEHLKSRRHYNLFQRHSQAIKVFGAFFMGIIIALSLIFMFFPNYAQVFYLQTTSPPLNRMASPGGYFVNGLGDSGIITGQVTSSDAFAQYFINNTQVMILAFILSTLFGAGAIFIFAWNASVIAVYLGLISKSLVATGFTTSTAYLYGVTSGLLGIALHGIPEILAYFFAGLAGGILSVGFIRERLGSREFKRIFKDALIFLAVAEVLIIIAALFEAFL